MKGAEDCRSRGFPWAVGALALGWLMALTGANGHDEPYGKFYSIDNWAVFRTAHVLLETGDPAWPPSIGALVKMGEMGIAGPLRPSPHGALYAKYNLGQPLLAVPFLGLGKAAALLLPLDPPDMERILIFSFFWLPAIAMAATCALLYDLGRRLWDHRAARWMAFLLLIATPAGPYGKYPFAEASIALCWLLAYWLIARRDRGPTGIHGFLSGVASGWAVFTREGSAVGLPAVFTYVCLRTPEGTLRWRALGAWALGAMLPISAAAGYNFLRFGDPFQTGYFSEGFVTPTLDRWYGLLLSPGKGLLIYAPPVLAALIGWPRFWRAHRPEAAVVGMHIVGYLIFYGSWWAWHGGWAWGPRFLIPLLPVLLLGVGGLLQTRWGQHAVLALGAIGGIAQVPGFAVDFQEYYIYLLRTQGDGFERGLIYDPLLSPILGQWQMLAQGQGLSLTFLSLEREGVPAPVAWVYRALAAGLLLGGVWGRRTQGACRWPCRMTATLLKPPARATGWGLLLFLFGLNARLWFSGLAQIRQPPCDGYSRTCLHLRFQGGIELVAWTPPPPRVRQGEAFEIIFWWRTHQRVPERYSVYVHFRRGDLTVFQDDHEHPAFVPLPDWIPGWIYPDPHHVRIPPNLPSGEYQIWVGLYRRYPPGGRIPTEDGKDGVLLPQAIQVTVDN